MEVTAEQLYKLPPAAQSAFFASITDREAIVLNYSWSFWARLDQTTPAAFLDTSPINPKNTWLLLAGRGFGKTRVGAEVVNEEAESGRAGRIGLVGETAADVRDVIVEGESGILAKAKPWFRPVYEPSKRKITWPNGALAFTYNATEPDQLRGPQHDFVWGDELAKWRYLQDTFDNAQMGLRLGQHPRQIFTTTPRPLKVIRELVSDPATIVTRGNTFDNARNLAPTFIAQIRRRFEGTRYGRQELFAEILDDMPGALWTRALLEKCWLRPYPQPFPLHLFRRIVIGVDPAVSNNEGSDETGLVVVGLRAADGHMVVLEDASGRMSPIEWATVVVRLYRTYKADKIVAEVNNGGDLVETTMHIVDPNLPVRKVHARKGKFTRAEPISAIYERGLAHHLGSLAELEDQMCQFTSDLDVKMLGYSPDRADAMVWAATELMIEQGDGTAIIDHYRNMTAGMQPTI